MDKEGKYFISILSDHISQKKTEPQSDIDWKKIYKLAHNHQVGGIVYRQCKSFLPDDINACFFEQYAVALYSYANYSNEINILKDTFLEQNVEMFTVKGLDIAQYYPFPALRTMGDIDIVVHTDKRTKADEILHQLQYTAHSRREDIEWMYRKQGMIIELHDHLVYKQVINKNEIEGFFNNCWIYVERGKMDASFHFLYLFAHLRKHLMNSGIGFRQFMDIAIMSKNETALNWEWIEKKLIELNLKDFSSMCFGFIQKWFDITIPIAVKKEIEDEFYKDVTNQILDNGVFGFDNLENTTNAAVNAARKNKVSCIGMLKSALWYVFPSYQALSDMKYYPYLAGKPFLLPVAWIHRFFRGICIWNFTRAKRRMKLKFASSETIKKRDEYLKKWGL